MCFPDGSSICVLRLVEEHFGAFMTLLIPSWKAPEQYGEPIDLAPTETLGPRSRLALPYIPKLFVKLIEHLRLSKTIRWTDPNLND